MQRLSYAYPPEHRIRRRADYLLCYEEGAKHHTRHFILYMRQLPQQPQRFGISVSKKVGNAVARNRIKRILREVFRLSRQISPGLQLVAVAKKNAAGISFQQARAELASFIMPGAPKTRHTDS